jgi:polyisoprenoid-binding protein YceI
LPSGASGTEKHLSIVQETSKAEFSLNEVLSGVPTLVLGTTNQIAGDIILDPKAPANIQIGEIKVNARTLKTDNDQRNGAIGRLILKSEDPANEFIVFKTAQVTGMPQEIQTDKEFTFKIMGDLTIRGVTKPVTFDATGTLKNDGTLTGTAKTSLTYGDFGLSVPNLSFLANVDKTVNITISVTAKASQ